MKVGGIHDGSLSPSEKIVNRQQGNHDPFSDFKDILSKSVKEVSELGATANQSVEQMVLGKTDIHQAMISMEEAGISFRLFLQVRNKVIAAYEEMMRTQV